MNQFDLFGLSTSVPSVIAAAAAMPDQIQSLRFISGCPKPIRDVGYPQGMAPDVCDARRRPGDAIRASSEVTEIAAALGIPIRAGIHFGEVEILDGDVLGVAVVIATRVMGLGGAGETITTSTVVDLVEDADHEWESIGSHDLKGISRSRELWSLRQPR